MIQRYLLLYIPIHQTHYKACHEFQGYFPIVLIQDGLENRPIHRARA